MKSHGVPSETSPARDRSEMSVPCRCCGKQLDMPLSLDEVIVAASLSSIEAAILRKLTLAGGQWLTSFEIAEAVYADHRDGGPANVQTSISLRVKSLRTKLQVASDRLAVEGSRNGQRLIALPEGRTNTGFRWRQP